jgi:hypothetical protein
VTLDTNPKLTADLKARDPARSLFEQYGWLMTEYRRNPKLLAAH